jgi:hypothetical protein
MMNEHEHLNFARFWVFLCDAGWRVLDPSGTDVTDEVRKGAQEDLDRLSA